MADIATLGLAIDSRSAVQATKDLDNFAASGAKASASAEQLARQNAQMAQSSKIAAESTKDLSYAKEVQRQLDLEAAAAADKFMFKLAQEAAQIGKTRAEILEMKAAMHGVSDGAEKYIQDIKNAEHGTEGLSFKTAGAKRELLVLAHELSQGNFKQFGGSMLVLGERTGAASLLFSAAGLAALGFAGAIAGVTYAIFKGAEEENKFNASLVLTGNYAGMTAASLRELADVSAIAGGNIGTAKEAVIELATSGKFTAGQIEMISKAAVDMQYAAGIAVTDIVKKFEELSKSPVEASLKLNETEHYLTLALFEQIQALEDKGLHVDAAKLAVNAYADTVETRAKDISKNLGAIERLWHAIKNAGSEAIDAIMQDGKALDKTQQLVVAQRQLAELRQMAGGNTDSSYGVGKAVADKEAEVNRLIKDAEQEKKNAKIAAENARNQSSSIDAAKQLRSADLQFDKQAKLNAELAKTQKWQEEIAKVDPANPLISAEANAKREAEIRKKYTDKPKSTTAVYNADLNGRVAEVKDQLDLIDDAYKNSEKIRAELHKAGLLSNKDFYSQERDAADKRLKDLIAGYETEKKILSDGMAKASDLEKIRIKKQLSDIEKAESKIAADATAQKQLLDIKETASAKKKKDDLNKLTIAAKAYSEALKDQLDAERESIAIQVKSIGQGATETAFENKLNTLRKKYEKENTKLVKEHGLADTPEKEALYDKEIRDLKSHYEQMVEITKEGQIQIKDAQGDWTNGAKQSLANYADYAGNVASQTASMFQDGFRNMEDGVVNFTMKGKLNFHNFAESAISDLIRIYIRQQMVGMVGSLTGFFGGGSPVTGNVGGFSIPAPDLSNPLGGFTFSAKGNAFYGGSVTAFAKGGTFGNSIVDTPTMAPMAVFGEAGPEAIMPLKRGPDGSLGIRATGAKQQSTSGDGIAIHTQINIASDGTAKTDSVSSGRMAESGKQVADMVNGLISKALSDQMRQGGLLWKMKNGQN